MCKIPGWVTVIVAAILAMSMTGRAGGVGREIVVEDTSRGCFHSAGGTHRFVWRDGSYLWRGKKVSEAEVNRIREAILEAPREPEGLLKALGVTPEKIAAKRDVILAASLPEHWRNGEGGLPPLTPEEEGFLTYEGLAPYLMGQLTREGGWSTTSVLFRVSLPGSPPLQVESAHDRFCMLPFTARYGQETWKIYDPNVPRMLRILADPRGANHRRLDGFAYWSEEVWNDQMFWLFGPGMELDRAFSTTAYKAMKGYTAASEMFRVEHVHSGYINIRILSVHLGLEVKKPGLINGIWWWVPLENGKTQHDWLGLIDVLRRAEDRANQNGWVRRWRTEGENRELELHVVGHRGYVDEDFGCAEGCFATEILPPWQDAGLRGVPEYEFVMRDQVDLRSAPFPANRSSRTRTLGTCFLGDEDDRLLVTRLFVDDVPWPGIRSFVFHPSDPSYVIVNGDGSVEIRRITDWGSDDAEMEWVEGG